MYEKTCIHEFMNVHISIQLLQLTLTKLMWIKDDEG